MVIAHGRPGRATRLHAGAPGSWTWTRNPWEVKFYSLLQLHAIQLCWCCVRIMVISYCWLKRKHPDPHGKQLTSHELDHTKRRLRDCDRWFLALCLIIVDFVSKGFGSSRADQQQHPADLARTNVTSDDSCNDTFPLLQAPGTATRMRCTWCRFKMQRLDDPRFGCVKLYWRSFRVS